MGSNAAGPWFAFVQVVALGLITAEASRTAHSEFDEIQDYSHLNYSSRSLPLVVAEGLEEMAVRKCALKIADDFEKRSSRRANQWAWMVALKAVRTRNRKIDQVEIHDDGIDESIYPRCKPGKSVVSCAASLNLMMQVQQLWHNQDVLRRHTNGWQPWGASRDLGFDGSVHEFSRSSVQLKVDLFQEYARRMDFNPDAALKQCRKQLDKADAEHVRSCVLREGTPLLGELLEKKWQMEDELMMLGMYATKQKDSIEKIKRNIKAAKLAVSRIDNYSEEDAIKSCEKDASKSKISQIISRGVAEIAGVCEGRGKQCAEAVSGRFCPAGFACDCQRAATPKRAKTAFTVGMLAGIPIVWGIGGAIGAVTTGPAGIVPGAMAAAAAVPDPLPGFLAAALFSYKFNPECMCFMLDCVHDSEQNACVLKRGSSTMKASSNPFASLPPDGMKCVPKGGDTSSCEMTACSEADAVIPGPRSDLFGRVGRIGKGMFNCANTEGTTASLLIVSDQISVPATESGMQNLTLPNSPMSRSRVLALYE